MAKITRATQKQFGTSGNVGTGGFGAAAGGNTATQLSTSTALSTIQGTSEYTAGWSGATLGASKFPALEDENALDYLFSTQLAYLFQEGIAEYDSATTYYTNGLCLNNSNGYLYQSLTDANIGNALSSITNWQPLSTRVALTAAQSFYVSPTGNDSNNGLTSGTPWLTLQHAIDVIYNNYDTKGFTVTLNCADGTYTAGVLISSTLTGGGLLVLNGNTATPANCIINPTSNNCISVFNSYGTINIQGFKLVTTASGNGIVIANSTGVSISGNMNFGAMSSGGSHININESVLLIASSYTISGGAVSHWYHAYAGKVVCIVGAFTITLTGTPAFSGQFVSLTDLADIAIAAGAITFSGSATGTRYLATLNSVINTQGSGATYFPGNGAGSVSNGGVYV